MCGSEVGTWGSLWVCRIPLVHPPLPLQARPWNPRNQSVFVESAFPTSSFMCHTQTLNAQTQRCWAQKIHRDRAHTQRLSLRLSNLVKIRTFDFPTPSITSMTLILLPPPNEDKHTASPSPPNTTSFYTTRIYTLNINKLGTVVKTSTGP